MPKFIAIGSIVKVEAKVVISSIIMVEPKVEPAITIDSSTMAFANAVRTTINFNPISFPMLERSSSSSTGNSVAARHMGAMSFTNYEH